MSIKSGTLGGDNLVGGVEKIAYECNAPAVAVSCIVSFCNKTLGPVKVRLAFGSGADSSAQGTIFLIHDKTIEPNGTLERTGVAISAGKKLFVKSDLSGVDVAVYGFEK